MPEVIALIHPETSLGHVHLVTGDLERLLRFYRDVLGFHEAGWVGRHTVFLSADGRYPFAYALTELAGAVRPPSRTAGLYHAAVLFPARRDLARVLLRLRAHHVALDGAADHLVSEALYLRDPDGNGLELYADRPRPRWPRRDGQIVMATDSLDLDSLLAEVDGEDQAQTGLPPGTSIGHVHLRVSDLGRAEAFYHGVLGFEVTVRTYAGALFLSAGGYHHHIGVNVWAGVGIPALPENSIGLRDFTVRLPDREALSWILRRAQAQHVAIAGATDHGLYQAVGLRDGDGIGVRLVLDRESGSRPLEWKEEPIETKAFLVA